MTKNKAYIINELCRNKGIHPECEEALKFKEMTIVDLLYLTKHAKIPSKPESEPEVQCPGQVPEPEAQPEPEPEVQPTPESASEDETQSEEASDSESDDESFSSRITRYR